MTGAPAIALGAAAILCGVLLLGAMSYALWQQFKEQRQALHRNTFSDKYTEAVYRFLSEPEPARPAFPGIRRRRSRLLLAEIAAEYATLTYGYDRRRMERIVRGQCLDRYLIRRARHRRGIRRAAALQLLSSLPLREEVAEKTGREFADDRNRYVRLYALMLVLGHFPDRAIELIAAHPYRLGGFELSEIAMLLRHRFVPQGIWEPMLDSDDRNLILLGFGFIRFFQIADAQENVIRTGTAPDRDIRLAALQTLAELHAALTDERIRTMVAALPAKDRKQLYRLLAVEGYSLHALAPLQAQEKDRKLIRQMEQAVNSRKRSLRREGPINR